MAVVNVSRFIAIAGVGPAGGGLGVVTIPGFGGGLRFEMPAVFNAWVTLPFRNTGNIHLSNYLPVGLIAGPWSGSSAAGSRAF